MILLAFLVVLLAQVSDLVLAHQPAQRVLEFRVLDEEIVLGISRRRELRAQTYEYVAEAHVALAARHGLTPADAKAHWSAACRALQQSGEVWADMRRRGILWGTDASKPDTLVREIEDCRTKLDGT